MKDSKNLHLKIQEHCDCFATTDPLKEMSILRNDQDKDEAALKWLALAILHGVNTNAEKISVKQSSDGKVTVIAKYRGAELPSPGADTGRKIMDILRGITHIDTEKGESLLAVGIRDSSIDLNIKIKDTEDEKKCSIKFP